VARAGTSRTLLERVAERTDSAQYARLIVATVRVLCVADPTGIVLVGAISHSLDSLLDEPFLQGLIAQWCFHSPMVSRCTSIGQSRWSRSSPTWDHSAAGRADLERRVGM
jgi:hypothetical protein